MNDLEVINYAHNEMKQSVPMEIVVVLHFQDLSNFYGTIEVKEVLPSDAVVKGIWN